MIERIHAAYLARRRLTATGTDPSLIAAQDSTATTLRYGFLRFIELGAPALIAAGVVAIVRAHT
jgi:hypothetical protein